MKKSILFTVLAFMTCFVFAQQQPDKILTGRNKSHIANPAQWQYLGKDQMPVHAKRPDLSGPKSLIWKWDTIITYDTLSGFIERHTQTFDINGNVLTRLIEQWQTNIWVNSCRYTYTYDGSGNMLTLLYEQWQTGTWVNDWRKTFTYDGNGNMLPLLGEDWQTNTWVNSWIYTYTYDGSGNTLTQLYEQWQTGTWVNDWRCTYTYDGSGNMLTLLGELWQTGTWVNSWRTTYTYDGSGNNLTELDEVWQTNIWVNYWIYTYTYDGSGNMLTELDEVWQTNIWVNYCRYIYTYDVDGNSITGKYEVWANSNWQAGMGGLQVYSKKNWICSFASVYRYEASFISFIITGIENIYADNSCLIIYPNPATDNLIIETPQKATIEILNIQGQLIKTIAASGNKTSVDVSAFPSGVYVVEIKTEKGIAVKKFVKE